MRFSLPAPPTNERTKIPYTSEQSLLANKTNVFYFNPGTNEFLIPDKLCGRGDIKSFAISGTISNYFAATESGELIHGAEKNYAIPNNLPVRKIACEMHRYVTFLTENGLLFEIVDDTAIVHVDIPNVKFKDILSGYEHTYYIAGTLYQYFNKKDDNSFYYNGRNNSYLQSATNGDIFMVNKKRMDALLPYKDKIRKISSGGWNAYCLLAAGNLITWGYNVGMIFVTTNKLDGRCGIRTGSHIATPVQVPIKDTIIDVSAGEWHCIALSASRDVYVWGLANNQATVDHPSCAAPAKIKQLSGVQSLYTTPHSTVNIVTKTNGEVFGWGFENPKAVPVPDNSSKKIQQLYGVEGVKHFVCAPMTVFFFTGKHKANVKRIEKFSDVVITLLQ